NGLDAGQMLAGGLKAVLLLNTEPQFDAADGRAAVAGLNKAQMVVTLSPFKANMEFSDVLLPIAPFTETPGTFVNAEGRVQGFHAVVKPLGEARPAWKVLRVLANMLGLPGFDYESAQDVLAASRGAEHAPTDSVQGDVLGNQTSATIDLSPSAGRPAAAAIYQLDSIVRRAPSLQLTADAKRAAAVEGAGVDGPPQDAREASVGAHSS
ncbi:MAG: molybdopterin-dependent oxidoreductase, partial [Telluria sp.]